MKYLMITNTIVDESKIIGDYNYIYLMIAN